MAFHRVSIIILLLIDVSIPSYKTSGTLLVSSSGALSTTDTSSLLCQQQKTCSQCIQRLGCGWCKDKDHDFDTRCFATDELPKKCAAAAIENPQTENIPVEGNKPGQKIKPERVVLKLRKGEKRNITIKYTNEKNRPLDLYIVMDLSCSMKDHKTKVATLAKQLADNLKNLTSMLKIGFGSFVDKPIPPFGYTDKPNLCMTDKNDPNEPSAVPPYGFRNHLPLTPDINKFIAEVNASGISSNIDAPEGTLDGLLQSIVCTKQIGWRSGEGNRKLVVISTDGPYHLAGDGKLVNVVLPHDGNCYVDETNMYTHSTILDYPSISLVREKVRENDVFVIFAVTEDQRSNYNLLTEQLHPFAVTEGIDNKNHSITGAIQSVYQALVNTVTLLSKYDSTYVNAKMFSKCSGSTDDPYEAGSQCRDVTPGKSLSYQIEVELKDCPPSTDSASWKSNITIYPQSLNQDTMTIQLEMLCGCDCEAEEHLNRTLSMKDQQKCSNHGFLQCGICKCNDDWEGPLCNCPNTGDNTDKISKCTDATSGKVCNDRGKCDACGKCVCEEKFGGEFCHCNNMDCDTHPDDNGLCNENIGAGSCFCSKCQCKEGFEGDRCQCSKHDVKCLDPISNSTCNAGTCDCGRCKCDQNHVGKFCEIMHARVTGDCDKIRNESESCVDCIIAKSVLDRYTETDIKKIKGSCREECEKTNVFVYAIKGEDSLSDEEDKLTCRRFVDDNNDCRTHFVLRGTDIHTKKTLLGVEIVCPTPFPIVELAIACASALVLGGIIILLIWKIFTHIQDRKEYARFEKSISEAAWNMQNPLYKETVTEFQNPAHTAEFED